MPAILSPRAFLALLLAASFALPLHARAAAEDDTLTALRTMQIAIYAVVRNFHMETLLSGDPARTEQLEAGLERMQTSLDKAADGGADTAAIGKAFAAFEKAARSNNVVADGYTDDILVGDLYQAAEELNDLLTAAVKAAPGGGKQRAVADRAHAANLVMQRSAAAYIKRTAQMSPDIGAEIPYDLGEATRALDKQMTALAAELRKNPASAPTMRNVTTKWNFIKGSLLNYNDKAVPFIVDRYAQQIREGLETVVSELSQ